MMSSQNWALDLGDAPRQGVAHDILVDLAQRETTNRSAQFAQTVIPRLGQVSPLLRNTHRNAGFFVLLAPDVPAVLVGAPGRPPRRPRAVRLDGRTLAPSESLVLSDDPEALRGAEVVLVTVKSTVTPSLAAPLTAVLPPETPVVSLQNGLHNATWLAIDLGQRVVSGVVSYNVFNDGDDRHQATGAALLRHPRGHR